MFRKFKKCIKEMFCKHNWEEFTQHEYDTNANDMYYVCWEVKYRRCTKCGKIERL